MNKKTWWTLGIVVSNIVGLATVELIKLIIWTFDRSAGGKLGIPLIASHFIIIPLGIGIVSSFFWHKIDLQPKAYFSSSLVNTVVTLCVAFFVMREGTICLLMVSPLLFALIYTGCLIGIGLWKKNPWLGVGLSPLCLMLIIVDASMPHQYRNIVTDEVVIRATPQKIWRYVPAYPAITTQPNFWLWKIGVPVPVQSTADGAFVGARRACIFTSEVIYREKIVEVQPARLLTFDITEQPTHPEILGHFVLERGRFTLRDNGNGTTTLIGTSWYRLNVYPASYFDFWATAIVRNVHWRVMDHIKELAEQ